LTACELAIIGTSCRLPGRVEDLHNLWDLLDGERCAVTEIPDARWTKAAFFSPDRHAAGKAYTFAAGVIENIDRFDPAFFGLAPREVRQMDPQQRLALELAAAAFDDAGLAYDRLAGRDVGVFVGASSTDYADIRQGDPHSGDAYFMTGSALSILANRVSYAFDLHGPSYVVDTACSSSLVALDAARRAMADGRVELALVGGVNLLLSPLPFVGFCRAGMLSAAGRCRPFDAAGDGYVRAEGGGFVVLKPLAQALADGDRIHAVVRASGTNADGRTAGLSLPDHRSQRALLERVYGDAGLDPARLVYLEAHGTGTAVGDPAEATSIGEALAAGRGRVEPLPVGSVKGNVGHLEPASGMAGLLKAIALLAHRRIPRSLFFETPNPAIDFAGLGLRVVDRAEPLAPRPGDLVGVNSFGFGGANAHVVLEAPPSATTSAPPATLPPVIVTAHSRAALAREAAAARAALAAADAATAYDQLWTRAFRRRFEAHRLVVDAADRDGATAALDDHADEAAAALARRGEVVGERPRTAFVFSGNGSQWVGMGRRLLEEDAAFRAELRAVDAAFAAHADLSIEALLGAAAADDLAATERAQPMLFALQVAIARRLEALGLAPDVVVGHSVGEVAAAHVAGLLSLEDAVAVIFHRSHAQGLTRGQGRMMALAVESGELDALLAAQGGEVEIAGINAPGEYTLAGPEPALAAIAARCAGRGRFAKLLELDYAFHSRAMAPVEAMIEQRLAHVRPRTPRCEMVSTVTGAPLDPATLARSYWWRNIREPVAFADAFGAVVRAGPVVAVEIGPKPVLAAYMRKVTLAEGGRLAVVPSLAPGADGPERLRAMVADAFVAGARVDWSPRFAVAGRVATLPPRALEREPYWFAPSGRGTDLPHPAGGHPLLGFRARESEHRWERDLDLAAMAWLGDHRVGEQVLVPAAGFAEMALAAAAETFGQPDAGHRLAVNRLDILRPLRLEPGKIGRSRVELAPLDGRLTIAAAGADARSFALHAAARVERTEAGAAARRPRLAGDDAVGDLDPERLYARAERLGLHYGQGFRRLARLRSGADVVTGELVAGDDAGFQLPPAVGDAALQALLALLPPAEDTAFLPVGCARLERLAAEPAVAFTARIVRRHRRSFAADIEWYGADGTVVARAMSFRFRAAPHLRAAAPERLALVLRPRAARTRERRSAAEPDLLLDVARRTQAGVGALRRAHYREETAPLLAAAAADYARRALAPAVARTAPRDLGALAATLGCPSDVRPLLRRLVAMLEEDGRLVRDPDGWRLVENDELPAAEPILRAVVADSPEHAVDALLLARAGAALARTLAGERDADDERLEDSPAFAHWQHGSPVVGDGRRALLAAVDEAVRRWGDDRFLRVLNVSAGDAAFAHALAERLPAERTRLVHLALTHRARGTLEALTGDRPYVRVEEHPLDVAEVVADGDFDLVVANHALHVTRDDDAALGALRLSLAPGGVALIAERQVDRLADMVFEGSPRWLPAAGDAAVRPRVGTAHHWLAALDAAGFVAVRGPEDPAEVGPGEGFVVAAARSHEEAVPPAAIPRLRPTGVPDAAVRVLAGRLELVGDEAIDGADGLWWLEPASERGAAARVAGLIQDVLAWLDADGDRAGRRWVALRTPPVDPTVAAAPSDPLAAALWGALRVAANERPDVELRLVELRGFADAEAAARALAGEMAAGDGGDDEVVLTPARRFVPRLVAPETATAAPARAAVLDMPAPGALHRLVWRPLERRAPGPGEVEIAVEATGLNFRDVMLALGLLGDEAVEDGFAGPHLGMECAGTITAVGAEVDDLAVGDAVVAFAPACFATHVTTATTAVAKRPEHLPAEAAATLPAVFFSAYYALAHLARLQPGETVLIHGAAGGVGLAAVQIAHALGAQVVVTAGSAEKQAFLRLLGLERIATSRSLRFADEIDELTAGEGVDVVLNALAGAAIEKSLALLKPFGRFLELGKRDLYADSPIGLAPFRRNISYFGVDADQVMAQRPALARAVFREVLELLAEGALRPIPYRAFDAAAVSDAFALMQTARHIGKIVVRIEDPPVRPEPVAAAAFTADGEGWHVVTGGLAGFGLATARWLAARGARRLALWSRSGGVDADAEAMLAALRADGVEVETGAVDVTDAAAVDQALASLRGAAPIRGVVHAAAVFDDAPLAEMDVERLERVLAPKLDGARVLDRATAADRLDLFVLYSSATTAIGNPGQANYVAANLALESLAAERRARGLPALAVAWGPIADVGVLTRNEAAKKTLTVRFGRRELDAASALDALGRLLAEGTGDRFVAHLEWGRVRALPGLQRTRRFDELVGAADDGGGPLADGGSLEEQLAEATPAEAQELVLAALGSVVAGVLGLPADRVEVDAPLLDLGMDSLMGVELAMAFKDKAGLELPVSGIGEGTTVRSLAHDVVARVHGGEAPAPSLDPILERHGLEEEAATLAPLRADDPLELENAKMKLLP